MSDIYSPYTEIMIFKKILKNSNEIINYFEDLKEWDNWYTFGKMVEFSNSGANFYSFPSKEEWDSKIPNQNEKNNKYVKQITDIFYQTTKLYFEKNKIEKNNLSFNSFNIAKYFSDAGVSKNLAMNYHTDFQQERFNIPEYKFFITTLFYLNDNYDGGEICFKKLNLDQTKIEYSFDYKPSAGDVIVFPSTPPFYHGVKKAINGEKYIIRTYWKALQEETDIWKSNVEKYGQENWNKIQKEDSLKLREEKFNIGLNYFQGMRDILNKDKI